MLLTSKAWESFAWGKYLVKHVTVPWKYGESRGWFINWSSSVQILEAYPNLYPINSERKEKEYSTKTFETLTPFPNDKCIYLKTKTKHFINFRNTVCAMDFKLKGKQGAVMVSSVQSSSLNGSLTLPERYALDETSIFSPVTALASTLTEQIPKQMVVSVSRAGNTAVLDFLHRIFLKYSTTPRTGAFRMQPLTALPPCHRMWRAKNDPSRNQHQGLSLYHWWRI